MNTGESIHGPRTDAVDVVDMANILDRAGEAVGMALASLARRLPELLGDPLEVDTMRRVGSALDGITAGCLLLGLDPDPKTRKDELRPRIEAFTAGLRPVEDGTASAERSFRRPFASARGSSPLLGT